MRTNADSRRISAERKRADPRVDSSIENESAEAQLLENNQFVSGRNEIGSDMPVTVRWTGVGRVRRAVLH